MDNLELSWRRFYPEFFPPFLVGHRQTYPIFWSIMVPVAIMVYTQVAMRKRGSSNERESAMEAFYL